MSPKHTGRSESPTRTLYPKSKTCAPIKQAARPHTFWAATSGHAALLRPPRRCCVLQSCRPTDPKPTARPDSPTPTLYPKRKSLEPIKQADRPKPSGWLPRPTQRCSGLRALQRCCVLQSGRPTNPKPTRRTNSPTLTLYPKSETLEPIKHADRPKGFRVATSAATSDYAALLRPPIVQADGP